MKRAYLPVLIILSFQVSQNLYRLTHLPVFQENLLPEQDHNLLVY